MACGGGVRQWPASWRQWGAAACDKGGGGGVLRLFSVTSDDTLRLRGEMKRYVKDMSGHKFAECGGVFCKFVFL
jgi:hypothetical protein